MSNYKESNITGTQYSRCNEIHILNPLNATASVNFREELVTILSDTKTFQEYSRSLGGSFAPTKSFPIIDPDTNEPTGETKTWADMYILLYSAYMNEALEQDLIDSTPEPEVQPVLITPEPEVQPVLITTEPETPIIEPQV